MSSSEILVAPSILSADFARLGADCVEVVSAGCEVLHVDVMDGHFCPNISIGFPVIQSLSKFLDSSRLTNTPVIDAHIMITDPKKWVGALGSAGANHVTFHIEACPTDEYAIETASAIVEAGMSAGIALKPGTSVDRVVSILDSHPSLVSMILVMTVEPGFSGQKYMSDMVPKIRTLRQKYPKLHIQVDGGISSGSSGIETVEAGANVLVAASAIFGAKNRKEACKSMLELGKRMPAYVEPPQTAQGGRSITKRFRELFRFRQ